jgi:hypothetical protein
VVADGRDRLDRNAVLEHDRRTGVDEPLNVGELFFSVQLVIGAFAPEQSPSSVMAPTVFQPRSVNNGPLMVTRLRSRRAPVVAERLQPGVFLASPDGVVATRFVPQARGGRR